MADKQKMLFLAQLPPPSHGVTTMSLRVLQILKGVPCLDVEQHWLGSSRSVDEIGRRDLRKIIGFARLLGWLVMLWLSGRRVEFTYQTLAPHGDAALRDLLLIALSKRIGKRALVHLHTRGLEDILAGAALKQRLMRWGLRDSELIAITKDVAQVAAASGVFSRVHWLPNLVEDPGTPPHSTPAAGELRVGFLGHADPRKGVLRFIDAVRGMKDAGLRVRACMAGGPSRHLSIEALCTYARERGVGDIVDVRGLVTPEQRDDMFAELDLFVYPTEHDLSPLVVLEAMVLETVPIVYDTGGLREMLGDEFADHVIKPGQDDSIDRIVQLAAMYASNPASLAAAKALSRRRVLTCYSEAAYRRRLGEALGLPVPDGAATGCADDHRAGHTQHA
ncbi:MAG: glycosyltransferase family 4 protein [Alphaproteobacteria bacterium]|nr:glycosyltransferase family 4 protein [Alphaproteobacteria bacterium]